MQWILCSPVSSSVCRCDIMPPLFAYRPAWHGGMTAEELQAMERQDFLDWRRSLAELQDQEHILITPYERNLEFWRQLWRVIERRYVTRTLTCHCHPSSEVKASSRYGFLYLDCITKPKAVSSCAPKMGGVPLLGTMILIFQSAIH